MSAYLAPKPKRSDGQETERILNALGITMEEIEAARSEATVLEGLQD